MIQMNLFMKQTHRLGNRLTDIENELMVIKVQEVGRHKFKSMRITYTHYHIWNK